MASVSTRVYTRVNTETLGTSFAMKKVDTESNVRSGLFEISSRLSLRPTSWWPGREALPLSLFP